MAKLQIQYSYFHSNEILPKITFVYNYPLLLINFIVPFHIAYLPKQLQTFSIRNQCFKKYSMIYYVIITKNINSKILFSLNNKFKMSHFKSIF